MARWHVYLSIHGRGESMDVDIELDGESSEQVRAAIARMIPNASIRRDPEPAQDHSSALGMDFEGISAGLSPGEIGVQNADGFELGHEEASVGAVVIPSVMCSTPEAPVPQLRFISPYDLQRSRLVIVDRLYVTSVAGEPVVDAIGSRERVSGRHGLGVTAALSESERYAIRSLVDAATPKDR